MESRSLLLNFRRHQLSSQSFSDLVENCYFFYYASQPNRAANLLLMNMHVLVSRPCFGYYIVI